MKLSIEEITPLQAKIFLKNNPNNRNINDAHVNYLAGQMLNGQWKENGETIIIDKTGAIMDGQHRLSAVIVANMPIKTALAVDVDRGVMNTVNTGKIRSAADCFTMNGVKNANSIAALCNKIYQWKHLSLQTGGGANWGFTKPSNQVIYDIYTIYKPAIERCIKIGNGRGWKLVNSGQAHMAVFLLSQAYEYSLIECFGDYMSDGGDYAKSPSHFLPIFLTKRRQADVKRQRHEEMFLALYCFEKWVEGKTISTAQPNRIIAGINKYYERYEIK